MKQGDDSLKPQRTPQALVRLNWVYLVSLTLIFIMAPLPYLLSPYVYITHNPVDDALVTILGAANVRPVLYLCTITGGLVGLSLYIPIHRLYVDALRNHAIRLRTRHVLLVSFGPSLGILWSTGLQTLWNYVICPLPNTGNLLSLFFALPGIFFGIVVSLVNLIEYRKANHSASIQGFSLQFTMIRHHRDSYRLELVPVHDRVDQPSPSQSIGIP